MRAFNSKNLKGFVLEAEKIFGCTFLPAGTPGFQSTTAFHTALKVMGVRKISEFLGRHAITVGNMVYLPFDLEDDNRTSVLRRVEVIAHELVHVTQSHRDTFAGFGVNYTLSKSKRAHYEAEAFHADIELHYAFTGQKYDVSKFTNMLGDYRLRWVDKRVVERHLDFVNSYMVKGHGSNAVINWTLKFWQACDDNE